MEAIVSSDHRRRMKEAALASRARCWFTPKWSPRRGYRSAQTGEPDRNCSMGAGGAVAEVADVYRWALDAPAEASDRVSRLLRQRSRSILNSWACAFSGFREEHFDFFTRPSAARRPSTQFEIQTLLVGA